MPRQGFVIYAGPVFGDNLWFNGFQSRDNYTSGALSFIRNMKHWMAPMTLMNNIGFGFDDSLGEQIVKPWPFYYTNNDCFMRENWQMVACKLIYGKLNVRVEAMGPGEKHPQLEMRRDDIPNEKETLTGVHTGQFTTILGGTHSYSLHWNGKIPKRFIIFGEAVQKSHAVRLAICLPKNADFDLWSYSPRWRPNKGRWTQVNDLASVDADPTGAKYMYDKNSGLLFVKFIGKGDRNPNMRSLCAGHCPVFRVTVKSGDRNNGNCVGAMYPKYQRFPATSDVRYLKNILLFTFLLDIFNYCNCCTSVAFSRSNK
ncbi:hypothetical protein FSP39_008594 [Pinctada imbricata]|uniref:CEMIP domain-containing protein n=1 Tax=Pinctada imbricata TaxID=66713 RepID=A0AA88YH24_PINIB|nr:hypothetical protein FSP39_008594 [Pinctada imbricata]